MMGTESGKAEHAADEHAQPPQPAVARAPRRRETRERIDVLLVERGLAPSRERARALIMAHEVQVDGQRVEKAGTLVLRSAVCTLVGPAAELRYASRGGLKLEHALQHFGLSPQGRICLDVGASTGGFTDVLLRAGAERVYAVDVGWGQLAWAVRTDPRVVVMDRTNIRNVRTLPEPVACIVVDVSFISLRLVLPHVAALLSPSAGADGWVVALVKPQFEAGRAEADRGAGVIVDPAVHRRVLRELLATVAALPASNATHATGAEQPAVRLAAQGLIASPITGRDGNHEYLLWLAPRAATEPAAVGEDAIAAALHTALGTAE